MIRREHKCSNNHDYSAKGAGLTQKQKDFVLLQIKEGTGGKAIPMNIFSAICEMTDDERKEKQLYNNDGVNTPSLSAIKMFIKNSNKSPKAAKRGRPKMVVSSR